MKGHEAIQHFDERVQKQILTETKVYQKKYRSSVKKVMDLEYENPAEFLESVFYWEESDQGHEYWVRQRNLVKNKFL